MPLVDIQLIEGVPDDEQMRITIEDVTKTMVCSEGKAVRGVTWVRIKGFASGAWATGGTTMTTVDPRAAQHQGI